MLTLRKQTPELEFTRHHSGRTDKGKHRLLTAGPGIPRRPSGPNLPGCPCGPTGPIFPGGPCVPCSPYRTQEQYMIKDISEQGQTGFC